MIVYKITNKINNKIYIGQTVKTITERFSKHINSVKRHSISYIHRAIRKYGKENFIIEEIEKCNSSDQLNEREIFWIKKLNSKLPNGYNLTDGGGGISGYKLSKETKQKISKSLIGNACAKGKHWKLSNKTKEKMSKSKIGNTNGLGYKHTDEAKGNISKNHRRIQTEDTKKKISEKHKNKILSKEHCQKISESKKGNTYRRGKKHSMETIEKMKTSHKNISSQTRLKMKLSHIGKKHSIEHKRKISESMKNRNKLK